MLETADGQILVNGKDKPGLRTGSCNTRESYLLETLTHNSPCPLKCKFRASPCFREMQDTTHQLTGTSCNTENQHPPLHPEEQAQVARSLPESQDSRQPKAGRNPQCSNVGYGECTDIHTSTLLPLPDVEQQELPSTREPWAHVLPQLVCPGAQQRS